MTIVRWVLVVLGAVVAYTVGVAVFERLASPRVLRAYQKHIGNPMYRGTAGFIPGWALIETTGRRTGQKRRVPIGGRLTGNTFWIVANDRPRSGYVHNIQANPAVRLRVRGRWRSGTAHLCPDDDPRRRLLRLNPWNSFFLWITARELLSIRIDLDA